MNTANDTRRLAAKLALGFAVLLGVVWLFGQRGAGSPEEAGAWRPIEPAPLSPRESHTAIWTGTEMIVWGGQTISDDFCRVVDERDDAAVECETSDDDGAPPHPQHADGAAYDPATDIWRSIADAPVEARVFHRAVWTGTEMIVWGGSNGFIPDVLGAAYDPATDAWRELPPVEVEGSWHPELLWDGSHVWLFTGDRFAPGNGGLAHRYDPTTDTWHDLGPTGLDAVFDAGVIDGVVHVAGTRQAPPGVSSEERVIVRLDPTSGRFTPLGDPLETGEIITLGTDADGGFALAGHNDAFRIGETSVDFVGEQQWMRLPIDFGWEEELTPVDLESGDLLVYGDDAAYVGELGGSWAVSRPPGEASRRYHHSVVWTGTELILWGGRGGENGAGSVASGYAFTPTAAG